MEYPPNFQRDDFDMALFYLKDKVEGTAIISLGSDELLPVCSAEFAKAHPVETAKDLQPLRLLHDAAWRDHWQLWLDHAGFTAVDASKGSVFSIYSLALQAAIDGSTEGTKSELQSLMRTS